VIATEKKENDGGEEMKRVYATLFAAGAALVVIGVAGNAEAKVSGRCDDCHTMHNSQDGVKWEGNTTNPQGSLTVASCAGCHTLATPGANTNFGGGAVPAVIVGTTPTSTDTENAYNYLPGGYINQTALQSTMHNVVTAGVAAENAFTMAPGGALRVGALTCAATTGCHGNMPLNTAATAPDTANETK